MKCIHWLVLNDGVAERITEDDVDPAEEAAVIDRVLIPMTECEVGMPRGKNGPYTTVGEISGKYALVRLLDEGAPLADVAVCLHSRAAPGLWRRLWADGPADENVAANYADMPPAAPWCVVRCHAPEEVLPAWFDHWTQALAMAIVRREGW